MEAAPSTTILQQPAEGAAIHERDWRWFGHAGHFICGRWCRFHLCTQVGGFLVSTVGQYVHPMHSKGSERTEEEWLAENPNGAEIGCDRFYETMVFEAGEPCSVPECGCGLPTIDGSELDMRGYENAAAATRGHREMCQQLAGRALEETP